MLGQQGGVGDPLSPRKSGDGKADDGTLPLSSANSMSVLCSEDRRHILSLSPKRSPANQGKSPKFGARKSLSCSPPFSRSSRKCKLPESQPLPRCEDLHKQRTVGLEGVSQLVIEPSGASQLPMLDRLDQQMLKVSGFAAAELVPRANLEWTANRVFNAATLEVAELEIEASAQLGERLESRALPEDTGGTAPEVLTAAVRDVIDSIVEAISQQLDVEAKSNNAVKNNKEPGNANKVSGQHHSDTQVLNEDMIHVETQVMHDSDIQGCQTPPSSRPAATAADHEIAAASEQKTASDSESDILIQDPTNLLHLDTQGEASRVTMSMMEESAEGASQLHSLEDSQAQANRAVEKLTAMFQRGHILGGIYWASSCAELKVVEEIIGRATLSDIVKSRLNDIFLSKHEESYAAVGWEPMESSLEGCGDSLGDMSDWECQIDQWHLCSTEEIRFRKGKLKDTSQLLPQSKYDLENDHVEAGNAVDEESPIPGIVQDAGALKQTDVRPDDQTGRRAPSVVPDSAPMEGMTLDHSAGCKDEQLPGGAPNATLADSNFHHGDVSPVSEEHKGVPVVDTVLPEESDEDNRPASGENRAVPLASKLPPEEIIEYDRRASGEDERISDLLHPSEPPAEGNATAQAEAQTGADALLQGCDGVPGWFYGPADQDCREEAEVHPRTLQGDTTDCDSAEKQATLYIATGSMLDSQPIPVPRRRPLPVTDTADQAAVVAPLEFAEHHAAAKPVQLELDTGGRVPGKSDTAGRLSNSLSHEDGKPTATRKAGPAPLRFSSAKAKEVKDRLIFKQKKQQKALMVNRAGAPPRKILNNSQPGYYAEAANWAAALAKAKLCQTPEAGMKELPKQAPIADSGSDFTDEEGESPQQSSKENGGHDDKKVMEWMPFSSGAYPNSVPPKCAADSLPLQQTPEGNQAAQMLAANESSLGARKQKQIAIAISANPVLGADRPAKPSNLPEKAAGVFPPCSVLHDPYALPESADMERLGNQTTAPKVPKKAENKRWAVGQSGRKSKSFPEATVRCPLKKDDGEAGRERVLTREIRRPARFQSDGEEGGGLLLAAGTRKRAAEKDAREAGQQKRQKMHSKPAKSPPIKKAAEAKAAPGSARGIATPHKAMEAQEEPKAAAVKLGCSKCRYSKNGCRGCREKAGLVQNEVKGARKRSRPEGQTDNGAKKRKTILAGKTFMLSGVEEKTAVKQLVMDLGGKVLEDVPNPEKDSDFQVDAVISSRPGTRTLKNVMAVIHGRPLLHVSWLHACLEAGSLQDDSSGPHVARPGKPCLTFVGKRIRILNADDRKILTPFLTLAGATVVDTPPYDLLVAEAPQQDAMNQGGCKAAAILRETRAIGVPVRNSDWVLDAFDSDATFENVVGDPPCSPVSLQPRSLIPDSVSPERHRSESSSPEDFSPSLPTVEKADKTAKASKACQDESIKWLETATGPPDNLGMPVQAARTYYSAFKKEGVRIGISDCVELHAVPGEAFPRVAQIEALWSDGVPQGGPPRMLARCKLFQRPQETTYCIKLLHEHEIYYTDKVEHRVNLVAVLSKCIVKKSIPAGAAASWPQTEAGLNVYYCLYKYNLSSETLQPI